MNGNETQSLARKTVMQAEDDIRELRDDRYRLLRTILKVLEQSNDSLEIDHAA